MKKRGRKLLASGMAGAMAASMLLTGCGGSNSGSTQAAGTTASGDAAADTSAAETTQASAEDDIEKPEKIKILVNGNVFTQVNARDEFEKRWEELTGIDLVITQPDHDAYNLCIWSGELAGCGDPFFRLLYRLC